MKLVFLKLGNCFRNETSLIKPVQSLENWITWLRQKLFLNDIVVASLKI